MGWTVEQARKASQIAPTPQGKGLTATIKVTVRDSGVTEVNGTPVWTAHPETGVAEAIAALLVEFYKKVDARRGAKAAPAPVPAPERITKTDAKHDLARRVLTAIAGAIESLPEDSDALAFYSVESAGEAIANMTHHFPAGRDADGRRWWPENLPRPDRSEWR